MNYLNHIGRRGREKGEESDSEREEIGEGERERERERERVIICTGGHTFSLMLFVRITIIISTIR
jgi:hypothetical protein